MSNPTAPEDGGVAVFDIKKNNVWDDILSNSKQPAANGQGPLLELDLASNTSVATALSQPTISITSKQFWDLKFSNTNNNSWFKKDHAAGSIDAGDGTGVFTLSQKDQVQTKLSVKDIYTKFALNQNGDDKPPMIVKFLTSQVLSQAVAHLEHDLTRFNGLWLIPSAIFGSMVAVRLCFSITLDDTLKSELQQYVKDFSSIDIEVSLAADRPLLLVMTQTYSYRKAAAPATGVIVDQQTCTIEFIVPVGKFDLTLTIKDFEDISISLTKQHSSSTSINSLLTDLQTALKGSDAKTSIDSIQLPTDFDNLIDPDFWYLEVSLPDGAKSSLWELGILCKFQPDDKSLSFGIGIIYNIESSRFEGSLLVGPRWNDTMGMKTFRYNHTRRLPNDYWKETISLSDQLKSRMDSISTPAWLPTNITVGNMILKSGPNGTFLSFATALQSPSMTGSKVTDPSLSALSWTSLQISTQWLVGGSKTRFSIVTAAEFRLTDINSSSKDFATINSFLSYSNTESWTMQCRVANLEMRFFAQFFEDENTRQMVYRLLSKAAVREVNLQYTFTAKESSSFCALAKLVLGELELDLEVQSVSTKLGKQSPAAKGMILDDNDVIKATGTENVLSFKASLGASKKSTTLGSCMNAFDAGLGDSLPPFIANIKIDPSDGDNPTLKLFLKKTKQGTKSAYALVFWVALAGFSLTFTQYISGEPGDASSTPTKRIIRVAAKPFEIAKDVPLVGKLPQPFDNLVYVYVSEAFGENGVSSADMKLINDLLTSSNLHTLISSNSSDGTKTMQKGHTFEVLNHGKLLLAHSFTPDASTKADPAAVAGAKPKGTVSPPTKAAVQNNSIPFVNIRSLSLQYKDKALHIVLDGTLTLGPISFTLIGFEVTIDLAKVSFDKFLDTISEAHITADIHGAGVALDKPPLLLAGVFIHEKIDTGTESRESYAGGIAVGLKVWRFVAVGEYSKTIKAGKSLESVFVFAKLDGPLVTLEFGTISGVRLGFGYNSQIREPSLDDLDICPFIGDNISGQSMNNPSNLLLTLRSEPNPWVTPKDKSLWFLMGMTITAFNVLSITAVAALMFSEEEVKIGLTAQAVGQMPPSGIDADTTASFTLFYIELLIQATVNLRQGSFNAFAVLGRNSHVFVPQCKLSGQAFLGIWFPPSSHAGDFVLTIGGFHRRFKAPDHYNPQIKRIGISCLIGNAVALTGQAYFALTPKAVMVGGEITITLDVAPIHAYARFVMDIFIEFSPFHYTADLQISVHVNARIDYGITTQDFDVDIACDLHLEGPKPFRGHAYVDFGPFAFKIEFGEKAKQPQAILNLTEMVKLVQAGNPVGGQKDDVVAAGDKKSMGSLKVFATGGLSTASKAGPDQKMDDNGQPWTVIAGSFGFRVSSEFAIGAAEVPKAKMLNHVNHADIHCRPMRDKVASKLTVKIYKHTTTGKDAVEGFFVEPIYSEMSKSLWQAFDTQDDLSKNKNPAFMTNGDSPTVNMCSGLQIIRPKPALTASQIPDFEPVTLPPEKTQKEMPGLSDAATVQTQDLHSSDMSTRSASERYEAMGPDWLGGLEKLYGKDGAAGNDLLSTIDKMMGWKRTRDDLPMTLAPPTRYLAGFDKVRLALPIVTA